jgi:hypothetical protein
MSTYFRQQIELDATGHREYFRKRVNPKWDASAQPARSDHPCSPNSKWRKYAFINQDRRHTIDSSYIYTSFEVVPEEANNVVKLYEADSVNDASCGQCNFKNSLTTSNTGYSGTGFYDFGGLQDWLEWTVDVAVGESGVVPVSFRFANGSSSYDGNRKMDVYVNDVLVKADYAFLHTDSWSYWKYSGLLYVDLSAGSNKIKLVVSAQNGGPNVDHMRVGKPPSVVLKTNGWPRTVATAGVGLLDDWPPLNLAEEVWFPSHPDPPQGKCFRRIRGYCYGL